MWILVATALAAPESFGDLLAEALAQAPSSAAIDARRQAGVAAARDRGALLEDPSATLEHVADHGLEARLQVPVPLAGQPVARARIAGAGVDAAEAAERIERARFAAEVGRAYLELQRASERATLAEDTLALAVRTRDSARALREQGEIGAVDALVAEALAAREAADALVRTQDRDAGSLRLEALVGRAPVGSLAPAGWPSLAVPDADPAEVPAVAAARAEAEGRRAIATLAAMDLLRPELIVGSEAGSAIVGVSVPLPILSPGFAGIRAASADARAADAEADALALHTAATLAGGHLELDAAAAAFEATQVQGLRAALGDLGAAFAAGEYGLAEYVARRDALVAGLESWIEAHFRLELARLEQWERLGRVPRVETP